MKKEPESRDFIREIIREDLRKGKNNGRVATRFPPEPNGFLHIGHAKSICLNFGIAQEFGGTCNLRFDDTNPTKEEARYVESIKEDVRWLGFDWGNRLYFASDYFEQLYQYALELIRKGKAYVDSSTQEEIREMRGTPTQPGKESPYRNRSVEENLELFERMRKGEFTDGQHVLRAKIDMASPNLLMRDPVLYRIRKVRHHRTGDRWCIYPMYDFTHCLSDAIEGITHSICTLEFEVNRPLYDWVLENASAPCHPQQIEFARLNLSYTVLSKRKLIQLVEKGIVKGWDDPRMPTIAGLRRRGYTAQAIRDFCERIGVARRDSLVDIGLLEHCVREDLNRRARRVMAVLRPLKVVIENFPEGRLEELQGPYHPDDPSLGSRLIPFSRTIFIEKEDFMEEPPRNFHRLAPGREVRLRYGFFIKCVDVLKDPSSGQILELRCTYDPHTRSGFAPDGRKVKGTIHWVSAQHSLEARVHLYDRLFMVEDPNEGPDFLSYLNPRSLEVIEGARVEPSLAEASPGDHFQFERLGYFNLDPVEGARGKLVFNRTVSLKDTWAKLAGRSI